MMKRILLILMTLTGAAFAQQGNTLMLTGAGAPSGNCSFMFLYTNSTNADLYNCLNGSWNKVTSAGGGAVTSWSGDGALLTNSGSTGAVTATVGNAAAHTFWGNNTGSSAPGAFLQLAIDDLSDAAAVVETDSANTFTAAGTLNLAASSGAASFVLPGRAGAAETTNGAMSYDSTNKNLHVGANGVDNIFAITPVATSITTGNCAFWNVVSSVRSLADVGSPCSTVLSVFSRTGAVTATSGDYTLDKIAGAGAAAPATLSESATGKAITFAGVETASLTYPYVFTNANSANSNTSGALIVQTTGTSSGQLPLIVNTANAGGGIKLLNGATVTNGVVSGGTQEWTVDGNGFVTQNGGLTVSSGVVTIPAGAVGGATSTFSGDTAGAGWYRPAAVTYAISNGTNEVMRLAAAGVKLVSGGYFGMTSSSSSSTGSPDTCWDRAAAGTLRADSDSACSNGLGKVQAQLYTTTTNCAAAGSAANPSVAACGAASSGSFSCATNASTGTCVVNTTAVTANSVIIIQEDDSLGTKLSVTCNTSNISPTSAPVAARSAATSFTINLGTITTNPECFSYLIIN